MEELLALQSRVSQQTINREVKDQKRIMKRNVRQAQRAGMQPDQAGPSRHAISMMWCAGKASSSDASLPLQQGIANKLSSTWHCMLFVMCTSHITIRHHAGFQRLQC